MRVLALLTIGVATCLSASDPKNLPPPARDICSPSGRYCLAIRTPDGWRSKRAAAELRHSGKVVWSKTLPHELGPRFALVADNGTVVLFDEWIQVASPLAIMILDPSGKPLRTVSFRDVCDAAGVSGADVVARARLGAWMSEPPALDSGGVTASVGVAARTLVVRLSDGSFSAR